MKFDALTPGATVAVIAPGSPVSGEKFAAGLLELERCGYVPWVPFDPTTNFGSAETFTASSVGTRVAAFHEALERDDVAAIFCARGGFGTTELLPHLDFNLFSAKAKPLIGYSDVCALLLALYSQIGFVSVHGGTVGKEFAEATTSEVAAQSVESVLALLTERNYLPKISGNVVREGAGEGPLLVSNLTMLQSLLGTPWQPSTDGAVLLLEEITEAPYRMRRVLVQLAQAGVFAHLSGIAVGRLSRCTASTGPAAEEVVRTSLLEFTASEQIPIVEGLAVGHEGLNVALPIGCRARIVAGSLEVLESPLR